ncbi:hypothetical protein Gotur_026470 [Gossypium turneri]
MIGSPRLSAVKEDREHLKKKVLQQSQILSNPNRDRLDKSPIFTSSTNL